MRCCFLLLCAALAGCASVSVERSDLLTARAPTRSPERILVRPPTFYDPALRVDRSGVNLQNFKYELQEKFTRNLVQQLSRHIAPAQAVASTAPLPGGNYWLIAARFDGVNQGSRLLRSVVGFGAGGTKLDMSTVVYDLSQRRPRPFLLMQTTGGSNAMPGAVGSVAYFVTGFTALFSAANLFEGTRSGLTFDILRTSREVTAALSEFLYQQGALSPDKAVRPKRIGSLP